MQHSLLLAKIPQKILPQPELSFDEPPDPHKEHNRPRPTRQPGGFGVEKDKVIQTKRIKGWVSSDLCSRL
jgi:hypothetical protein